MCAYLLYVRVEAHVFVLKRQNKNDIYLLSLQSLRGGGGWAGGFQFRLQSHNTLSLSTLRFIVEVCSELKLNVEPHHVVLTRLPPSSLQAHLHTWRPFAA